MKTLPIKDIHVYELLHVYFNFNKLKDRNNSSIMNVFVSKPEIKHFNNKINITLYVFNKRKTSLSKNFINYKNLINLYNKYLNESYRKKVKYSIKLLINFMNKQIKYKPVNFKFINILNLHINKNVVNKLIYLFNKIILINKKYLLYKSHGKKINNLISRLELNTLLYLDLIKALKNKFFSKNKINVL